MTALLVAIVFWWGMGLVAFGALLFLGMAWFAVEDWWRDQQLRHRMEVLFAEPPSLTSVPPYDWDDPLERQYLLPDAPNPTWRTA